MAQSRADVSALAARLDVPVELIEQQNELEQESLTAGVARYRKLQQKQGETATQPGMALLKRTIGPLSEAISDYIETAKNGRPVRGAAVVVKYLDQFDADVAAYITARYVLNAMAKRSKLQTVALAIAKALEDALSHETLRKENPGLYQQLLRKIAKSSDERYRHVLLKRQSKFAGIETIAWTTKHKLQLGELLVTLMANCQDPLVAITNTMEGRSSALLVMPTAETMEWLEKAHARCELFSPVFLPMIVKPRPWRGPFGGGYLGKHLRYALVKTANKNYLEELRAWEMPKVYAAINALQATPWAVNAAVLNVMREVWDGGGNLGGLPPRDTLPLPAKDFPEDALSDDPKVKVWRRAAADVYSENVRLVSKRVAMIVKLETAERFAKHERFYYPHALDWRGRAYPVVPVLNPQADDSAKALLQFADGAPLGDNGAFWLAVHGANCFGVDKVSFDERVAWVQENQDAIIECAGNPLDGSRWWAQADNPYQFLAFCMEWDKLVAQHTMGKDISGFVSYLPVSLDGSCNGLQNFSAMLRDEVGGKATNLTPNEKPSDIYAEVAKVANDIAQKHGYFNAGDHDTEGATMGRKWSKKITRKLVKRNTMTVPYAVTEFGMRDQLMQELRKLRDDGDIDVDFDFEDAKYLASVNYQAIGSVVVAARSAMDWLQATAKVAAKDGLPIKWVTPSGMLVVQDYREMVGQVFDSRVSGRRVQLTLKVETTKIDKRRMAAGISPNFVHSLDSAHMVCTVTRCLDAGVSYFAMVHDSFGTHAGNIDVLSQELRAAFVEQYEQDVLGGFRKQVVEQLPEELGKLIRPVPPFGTLEVRGVLASDYFFA